MRKKDELEQQGKRVLLAVKNVLYFDLPYLAYPIGNLYDVLDLSTATMGTDGRCVRFRPHYLFQTQGEKPGHLNRVYMHLLLHNLLFHPFTGAETLAGLNRKEVDGYPQEDYERDVWNLSCDIVVESIVDSMDAPSLRRVESDFRNHWYDLLHQEIRTFTAGRLCEYFFNHDVPGEEFVRLEREFYMDDHRFWLWDTNGDTPKDSLPEEIRYAPMTNLPLKEMWEQAAKAVDAEIEHIGSERTEEYGKLSWSLKLAHAKRRDYRSLLEKYMVIREVARVDPDAFDPAYYYYGMTRYGNMPLIEELEGREEKRVETLVIALDTSASTKKRQLRKFVSETVSMLQTKEHFFDRLRLHIIECDDQVQKDIEITTIEQMDEYGETFEAVGGYGTDYRPVFSYVADLRRDGKLPEMKALLYFTDGYGVYPKTVTDYDTVFVFAKDEDFDDTGVPDWAMKSYV